MYQSVVPGTQRKVDALASCPAPLALRRWVAASLPRDPQSQIHDESDQDDGDDDCLDTPRQVDRRREGLPNQRVWIHRRHPFDLRPSPTGAGVAPLACLVASGERMVGVSTRE